MITILSDDLTSALDGAAPFATVGLLARVLLREEAGIPGLDVVARDLGTRFLPETEAERRFFEAGARIAPDALVYKTVDSTLRGNLGAEIAGLAAATGRKKIVIAPAFPAEGRVTAGGRQYVNGTPVHESVFARDPRNPVRTSEIAKLLGGAWASRVEICDASTDSDLDRIVRNIGCSADVLWVGSPGLGRALARAVAPPAGRQASDRWIPSSRTLVVVGSVHDANRFQIDALAATGAILVESAPAASETIEALAQRLRSALAQSSLVCLLSPRSPSPLELDCAGLLSAATVLAAPMFDGIVITGGDTARRLTDTLDATSIAVAGEVEPGMPFGQLHCGDRVVPFAAKAGGFGSPRSLLNCVTRIQSQEPSQP